jgi:hypothetical protein
MRVLAILCLSVGIARAGSNEISLGDTTRRLPSSSAQALTDDALSGGGVAYARRLGSPLAALSQLELWVGGGFEIATTNGTMFQTISTDIDTLALYGLARARYPLESWVYASARIGVGSARAAVDLRDPAGHALFDSGWSALATGALGLELESPAFRALRQHAPMALGVRLELGYTRMTGAAIAPASDAPGGTLRLQMSQTPFGHLDLSGPFVSFALITSF